MASLSQVERIATLETQMAYLVSEQKEMNSKLDALLALKYKGAGAFWIITILSGTAFASIISLVVGWFSKGAS